MNSTEAVINAISNGASDLKKLFKALRRVIGDEAIWDGIREGRAMGLLKYDAVSGALTLTRAQ